MGSQSLAMAIPCGQNAACHFSKQKVLSPENCQSLQSPQTVHFEGNSGWRNKMHIKGIISINPDSYAVLLFTHQTLLPSPVTSTTGRCFHFSSVSSFFLELFLHWSPVAYWAPTLLGSSSFSVLSFAFSYCSWGSQGKNTEVVCHSLLQWTMFCQRSPPWPSHLGWPHRAWLSFIELDKAVVLVWLD